MITFSIQIDETQIPAAPEQIKEAIELLLLRPLEIDECLIYDWHSCPQITESR